jgi:predicted Zn-ribbon and HTH transcriptional regulator
VRGAGAANHGNGRVRTTATGVWDPSVGLAGLAIMDPLPVEARARQASPVSARAADRVAKLQEVSVLSASSAHASLVVLRCPGCGFSITPRFPVLAPEHCPRCVVRRRAIVALERSSPWPEAQRAARARAGTPKAPHAAERRHLLDHP